MDNVTHAAISLLGSAVVDMKTPASTTIFSVPAGKTAIIKEVLVRNPTASLAGGTSYSVTNFRQTFNLVGLTDTAGYAFVSAPDLEPYVAIPGGTDVQLTVTTGSTLDATAIIDVFGFYV